MSLSLAQIALMGLTPCRYTSDRVLRCVLAYNASGIYVRRPGRCDSMTTIPLRRMPSDFQRITRSTRPAAVAQRHEGTHFRGHCA